MNRITLDRESWALGYAAGEARKSAAPPQEVKDRLAFVSGYIEGKARPAPEASHGR